MALAAAIPLGLVLAFFFVLAPLFTDGPTSIADPERLGSLALTAGVVLAVATLLAWLSRGDAWVLVALGAPGFFLAAWYVVREPGVAVLAFVYAIVVAAALLAGRVLGLALRGGPSVGET